MKKENWATTIGGAIASIFAAVAFIAYYQHNYTSAFFYAGTSLNGYAIAFSPHILFEKVQRKGFKLEGHIVYGVSVPLMYIGNVYYVFGFVLWFFK